MKNTLLFTILIFLSGNLSGQQDIKTTAVPHVANTLQIKKCSLFSGDHNREEDVLAEYLQNGKIIVNSNDYCLDIRVAPVEGVQPDQSEYIYRLEGFSPNWFACDDASIKFVSLPYGEYTLAVRLKMVDGYYSKEGLRIPISVPRPFYLKSWFLGAILLTCVTGLFFFLSYWRITITQRRQLPEFTFFTKPPKITSSPVEGISETIFLPNPPSKNKAWLQQLEALSLQHIGDHNFTISHLAKKMLMGESNFYRQVHLLTGKTPNQYLKEIRLNKARQLLNEQPNISVKQLANVVGMKDVKYFSSNFKQQFGVSPSEFI